MPVDVLLTELAAMFDHRPSKMALRRKFEEREWKNAETFSDYFHEKLILANAVPVDEDELVDYLIDGIPDISIRNQARIQRFKEKKTLLEAFEKVSLKSDKKSHGASRYETSDSNNKIKPEDSKTKADESSKFRSGGSRTSTRCFNCNKFGHLAPDCTMPRRERGACFKCFKTGHQIKECPENSKEPAKDKSSQISNLSEQRIADEQYFKDVIYEINFENKKCELTLDTLLGTGSPISFIKKSLVPDLILNSKDIKNSPYSGINESEFQYFGLISCNVIMDKCVRKELPLFVIPDTTMRTSVVLGRDILGSFGLGFSSRDNEVQAIKDILAIEVDNEFEKINQFININPEMDYKIQTRFRELFTREYLTPERPESPDVKVELLLRLTDKQPFHFHVRRLSFEKKIKLEKIIEGLLMRKIIRPSISPYASPIIMTKKKNGEMRLCVDYRHLNKVTLRDNYPLPNIEDQIDKLRDKKFYTLLDLKDGFHHIKVAEESIPYTAFISPFGTFEYTGTPFGLKTAPPNFQRFINTVFANLIKSNNVLAYLDDILIATEILEQHFEILEQVFKLLVANKLELRLDKCKFLQTVIEYLGYRVTEKGISPTNRGIEAVLNYPEPKNTRELQGFLGLCSYFRKYIEGYSVFAKPLYDLLKDGAVFKFGKEELHIFESLKQKMVEAPVLSIYNPQSETELHCDASKLGFGAVLLQRQSDSNFHPICYFSKRTTEVESMYHSFELETLAIIYALRRFRIYLQGIHFKIITDCNSLKLTLDKKDINPKIARWFHELEIYEKTIEHRAGEKMKHLDALSRINSVMVIEENSFEANLIVSQNCDPKICEVRKKLQNAEDRLYEMRNGVIYRKRDEKILFYVPEKMENHIMRKYHDELGHLGCEKTVKAILRNYWFPGLRDKVKLYIANCLKCIAFSPTTGKRQGFLNPIPKGNRPFLTFHIDHLGPIDRRYSTKQHILLIIDGFTKFTKLYPVRSTDSKEAIICLTDLFRHYSRPNVIVSDRGTCFTSEEFETFMSECNIEHVKVATSSPKANGQIERVNSVLGPMLAKLTETLIGKYWYKLMSEAEFALNNTIHKATSETPSKLLFGVNQKGKIVDALVVLRAN